MIEATQAGHEPLLENTVQGCHCMHTLGTSCRVRHPLIPAEMPVFGKDTAVDQNLTLRNSRHGHPERRSRDDIRRPWWHRACVMRESPRYHIETKDCSPTMDTEFLPHRCHHHSCTQDTMSNGIALYHLALPGKRGQYNKEADSQASLRAFESEYQLSATVNLIK